MAGAWRWLWHRQADMDAPSFRKVVINARAATASSAAAPTPPFPGNRVSNTKYSLVTFLPRNLYEQFSRFMNQYFLLVACLQLFPTLTPVSPMTTWLPLMFIFAISAAKEAMDDHRRYRQDREANRRPCHVLVEGRMQQLRSQDVQVGDIVRVDCDTEFPADMVLLASAAPLGTCHVQTANLDGETDLKPRRAILQTAQSLQSLEALAQFSGVVTCPLPDSHVHSFDATLLVNDNNNNGGIDGGVHSLGVEQLLLQGTFLRNVEWVYGVVCYTGPDTKIGMNKAAPATKWTRLDRRIDRASLFVFVAQLLVVVTLGIIGDIYAATVFERRHSYLFASGGPGAAGGSQWYQVLIIPARMLLLLSYSIPISLKVTLDLVKYATAMFIDWDVQMYHPPTDEPAHASNTAIAEDLGLVEYIFTDKTGTLTNNVMVFARCSVGGTVYGGGGTVDAQLQQAATDDKNKRLPLFLKCLALCQSVVPTAATALTSNIEYSGSSPDEEELVKAAARAGVVFEGREGDIITLRLQAEKKPSRRFKVLHTLDFTSDRKRMSILVRDLDGDVGAVDSVFLFAKGADDVILKSCVNGAVVADTAAHVDEFAQAGFRTLCIAYKPVTAEEYRVWSTRFHTANTAMDGREEKVKQCYADIERGMTLLGATAIEDSLQPQVPETIQTLRAAGIKIWMLTGDKRATAVQIGIRCNLMSLHGGICCHVGGDRVESAADLRHQLSNFYTQALSEVRHVSDANSQRSGSAVGKRVTVVVDGSALATILADEPCSRLLVDVGLLAQSVICCRVSPKQKSSVVNLVKQRHFSTLAIGDGGNDVSMIQRAQIGVGIKGREGLQASRAADYSIAQFRFLARLVLVHGRRAYKRTSFVATYCFYKSLYIAIIQVLYELVCGFSGTSLLNSFALSTYNIFFTSLPILFHVLDRDISEAAIFKYPAAYQECVKGTSFQYSWFAVWVVRAAIQASLTIAPILAVFGDEWGSSTGGRITGAAAISVVVYTAAILVQTCTIILESNSVTKLNQIVIWGTLLFYLVVLWLFSLLPISDMYGTANQLFPQATFWLCIVLVALLALLPVFVAKYLYFNYRPRFYQIIQWLHYSCGDLMGSGIEMRISSQLPQQPLDPLPRIDTGGSVTSTTPLIPGLVVSPDSK